MKTIDLPRARKQIAEEILKRFDRLVCDILTSITSDEDISFEDRMELVDAIPYMADDVLSKIRFDIEYYKEKIENEENKQE